MRANRFGRKTRRIVSSHGKLAVTTCMRMSSVHSDKRHCFLQRSTGSADSIAQPKEISKINVRVSNTSPGEQSQARISMIEICYRDGTCARSPIASGGTASTHGSARTPFVLEPGEKLVKIRTLQGDDPTISPHQRSPASPLYGCQFYTDAGRVSEWFGDARNGVPGSFAGSAEDPITDIRWAKRMQMPRGQNSSAFCPPVTSVLTASGMAVRESRSDRADLLELLTVRSVRMDTSRTKLVRDAANIDSTKHYLTLSSGKIGKRTCSVCLVPTVSRGARCCGGKSPSSGAMCQKWVCESCYCTLISRHLAKPVLKTSEPDAKTAAVSTPKNGAKTAASAAAVPKHGAKTAAAAAAAAASPWMSRNSLENKAVVFCLSQLKKNSGPGAMSNIPEIPEQEVLRHIIELADPWYGQDKWDLCTVCNKILCPSCPEEVQGFVNDIEPYVIRYPTFPCCMSCADVLVGDDEDAFEESFDHDYSDEDSFGDEECMCVRCDYCKVPSCLCVLGQCPRFGPGWD